MCEGEWESSPFRRAPPSWGVTEMHTSHGEINQLKDKCTIFQFSIGMLMFWHGEAY